MQEKTVATAPETGAKPISAPSKICGFLQNFFYSYYFIYLTALIVLLSSIFSLEIFAFIYITLTVVLICTLCKSSQPLFVPLLMVVFCISANNVPTWYNPSVGSDFLSQKSTLIVIAVCAVICFLSFWYHAIKNARWKNFFTRRTKQTFGFLAFAVALFFNGVIADFSIKNIAIGLLIGVSMLSIYVFFIHTLKDKKLGYRYFCQIATALCLVIFVQTLLKFMDLAQAEGSINKTEIVLGWGVSNNIGCMFALLLPSVMYLAQRSNNGWKYIIVACLAVVGCFMTLCRASLLIIVPMFLTLLIVGFFCGNQRWKNVVTALVGVVIVAVIATMFRSELPEWFSFLINRKLENNGRFELYEIGWKNFLSSPVFGVGFSKPIYASHADKNFLFNMYHNTIVQVGATCGIVGLLAYAVMRFESVMLFVKKLTIARFFMGMSIVSLLFTSLFDNNFFYFYPMFFYVILLVLAERDLVIATSGKPTFDKPKKQGTVRVLIPLVEAGMGHITPALAISEKLCQNYGDKIEVICVPIFAESNSLILKDFEQHLVKFVVNQNKIPFFGEWSVAMLKLFGHNVSQKFVMDGYVPYAQEVAVEYLETFDCDVIINTHWSTAYYARFLKKRPLIIEYCPDACFNGMFDTKPDLLLISTDTGKQRALSSRFHYKSRIETMPFCLRGTIESVSHNKRDVRKKLDLDDRFTVVMVDGGYGAGKLEAVCKRLLKADYPINVIAVCGKNKKLYQKFAKINHVGQTTFMPVGFANNMAELLSASDLFIGKSGANTMAEPCYLGVPQIVSYCATPIEIDIANYYQNEVGSALIIKNPDKVVEKVGEFLVNPAELIKLKRNAENAHRNFDSTGAAEKIYSFIKENLKTL